MSKGKIIVFGILFWYPLAGVTFQFLHYLIGLRRLGYDVYYIEDSGRWVYDPKLNDLSPDAANNVAAVAPILEQHGFAGKWAFRGHYPDGACYGMTENQILQLYKDADAFLNVTGAQELRDEHMGIPRRIYVESDPFGSQVKAANNDKDMIEMLDRHDVHFTFGENVGQPDCGIPVGKYKWLPTRQPVVVDLWKNGPSTAKAAYNTITTWHNKGKTVTLNDEIYYWTKDREFEKFIDLPVKRAKLSFELATDVDDSTRSYLSEHGWAVAPAFEISRNITGYRDYILGARAEFTVARDQYVRPKTGWFSDRSACYLAAGRPVITQETGFSKFLPTGKGLFGFGNLSDILAAVEEIEKDYDGNCEAARETAAEYFAAERVLEQLLTEASL
jgi:hypothetical protein